MRSLFQCVERFFFFFLIEVFCASLSKFQLRKSISDFSADVLNFQVNIFFKKLEHILHIYWFSAQSYLRADELQSMVLNLTL